MPTRREFLWSVAAVAVAGRWDRKVLASSDFEYRGAYRVPEDVSGFSYGAMAVRRVAGRPSFLMTGHRRLNDEIYEFTLPDAPPNPDASRAPRAVVARKWGDVYQGRKTSWLPDHSIKDASAWWTNGLCWHGDRLFWTYGDDYNVRNSQDFSLGATALDGGRAAADGPWQLTPSSHQTQGYILEIPPAFGDTYCRGAKLAIGSGLASGNVSSSWGPVLHAFVPPLPSSGGRTSRAIPVTTLVAYSQQHRLTRDAEYVPHGTPDIAPSKGIGYWTQDDFVTSAAWIDLPDKHGVVFFGHIGHGHIWYGKQPCEHGFDDACYYGSGPHSSRRDPHWWIYDPADLAKVAAGGCAADAPRPRASFDPRSRHPFALGCYPRTTGAWFDSSTRLLYLSSPDADPADSKQPYPLIHVWRVV